MAIDYEKLVAWKFAERTHSYSWRDTVLYALGLGLGSDPVDPAELRFVYEQGLQALPTMPVVLGYPGFWISEPDTGIDFRKVVNGEVSLTIHTPLPPEGTLIARNSVDEIIDKGEGRGALLRVRRDLIDQATGLLQSTQVTTMFCRADGGFGGPKSGRPELDVVIPGRLPDMSASRSTLPQAALIYRLSADLNPLHADPVVAEAAGFPRPILHGFATFGIAGYALLAALRDADAESLRELSCRFSAPVFPGETLRTDIWIEPTATLFRCTAVERDKVVLDRGRAVFR
ncbi:acyl dehydratase [Sphingobium sp. OAS761]|uniref:MaoC/PaaZ C-terminal domain-containing protein n=1 Tax=Sphingobium sp. OAS761 TaxID=2817901 RepID=UPI0020A0F654|nr:MaoC/PaaZ C-terminal domain-containing protein [Sphingobium sp. OAS761]MCP1472340.1 acyl dehydratase [Sphingobium sp. OAS761]